MAVYSMTGYANATFRASVNHGTQASTLNTIHVELRSVNSRFLDINFRIPDEFRNLEGSLRESLSAVFRRGKIELRIQTQKENDTSWPQPQHDQLLKLQELERDIQKTLHHAPPLTVNEILHWCKQSSSAERQDDHVLQATQEAISGLKAARQREGQRLVDILLDRIKALRSLTQQAAPLLPELVQKQQQKFLERWQDALSTAGANSSIPLQTLQERALSEAASFAIKIDVAEELARLTAHMDEIERLLLKGGEVGKRLDFLIQELHREANTFGSKSAALELTQIAVEMKVIVEQLREQVQNIE